MAAIKRFFCMGMCLVAMWILGIVIYMDKDLGNILRECMKALTEEE